MEIPDIQPGNSLGYRVVATIASTTLGKLLIHWMGPRIDPPLIRLSRGHLSLISPFPALLLNHTGARTGVTRAAPLAYFTDAGRVIIIASNFGAAKHPGWYHNIKAHPKVSLLGRGFNGTFRAEEVTGSERDRLLAAAPSPYRRYQQSAPGRPFAVIACYPID